MSDQLTPDELAYIANWLSKPEVRAGLIKLITLFMSTPYGAPSMRGPLMTTIQQGGVTPRKDGVSTAIKAHDKETRA